ncbi:MAG: LysM peptidoglycan-binding domain-containing protein [Planctomycetaceae bacterium]
MHRDKKLGLALGVLLVGIVGAMFFRLDQGKRDFFPRLKSSRALDEQIAERSLGPYPDDDDLEADADNDGKQKKLVEPPLWEMPAFLADDAEKRPEDWLARTPAAPDPIPAEVHDLDMFDSGSFHGTPVPQHNKAWTVSDTKSRGPASPAQPQGVRIHRIRTGDTLSGLASYYLGSSARFNEIYNLNREVLANPNDLTVGVELKIPATVQPSRPSHQGNSIFHNADGQRVVEPGDNTGGPLLPVAPSSLKGRPNRGNNQPGSGAPSRRFIPADKPPFAPGRRDDRARQDATLPVKNTLSQTPPADLPNVD